MQATNTPLLRFRCPLAATIFEDLNPALCVFLVTHLEFCYYVTEHGFGSGDDLLPTRR